MQTMTLKPVVVDVLFAKKEITYFHTICLAFLGSIIIALSAQVAIPLPFTPIPISGQTFGVLLIATMLGAKRGVLSVLFYLFEGAIGLPVFAGLKGGLPHLIGLSGGYLIGFIACAYIVGSMANRGWDRSIVKTATMMVLGNLSIYVFGIAWLSFYVGLSNALTIGFIPFAIGDLIKITVLMTSMPLLWRSLDRHNA